jgi:hypothetical protein
MTKPCSPARTSSATLARYRSAKSMSASVQGARPQRPEMRRSDQAMFCAASAGVWLFLKWGRLPDDVFLPTDLEGVNPCLIRVSTPGADAYSHPAACQSAGLSHRDTQRLTSRPTIRPSRDRLGPRNDDRSLAAFAMRRFAQSKLPGHDFDFIRARWRLRHAGAGR